MFGAIGNSGFFTNKTIHPIAKRWARAAGLFNYGAIIIVSQLVKDLIAANLWQNFAMLKPYIGGIANVNRFNLVDPNTHLGAFGGTITHNINNVAFTSGSHCNHNIVVGNVLGANAAISQYIYTAPTADTQVMFGSRSSVSHGRIELFRSTSTSTVFMMHDGVSNTFGSLLANSLYTIQRTNSNNKQAYRDGLLIASAPAGVVFPTSTIPLFENALNNNGTPAFFGNYTSGLLAVHRPFESNDIVVFNEIIQKFIQSKNNLL
jgi:hypothetical protein